MRNNEINSMMLYIRNNTKKDRYSDSQYLKNTLKIIAGQYQKEYTLITCAVDLAISNMILSGRCSEKELQDYALRLSSAASVDSRSACEAVEYLNLLLTGRDVMIGKEAQRAVEPAGAVKTAPASAPKSAAKTDNEQPKGKLSKRVYIALAIVLVLIAVIVAILCLPSKSADSSHNSNPADSGYYDNSDVPEESDIPEESAAPDNGDKKTGSSQELSVSEYYGSTAGLYQVYFSHASASSQIYHNGKLFSADNAIDDNISTNWQEDATGDGIGEYLVLIFGTETEVKYISILPGYASDNDCYYWNNRPKEVKLEFSDGRCVTYTLSDSMDYTTVELSEPVTTSYVKIYIQSVYAGTKWDDTVISEVKAYR